MNTFSTFFYGTGGFAAQKKHRALHSPLLQIGLTGFFLLIIILAWSQTLAQQKENRKFIIHGLQIEQTNLAAIISENLFQVLDQNQAINMIVQDWLNNRQWGRPDEVNHFIYSEQAFNRVALFDLSGQQIYQTSAQDEYLLSPALIRQLIAQLRTTAAPAAIIPISKKAKSSWQIPILFPTSSRTELTGAMLLELNLGYFLNLLQSIDIGPAGHIGLCTDRGEELARFENGGLVMGSNSAGCAELLKRIDAQQPNMTGYYHSSDQRLLAFRPVAQYPLIVTVSRNLREALAEFNAYRLQQIWVLAVLTLVGLAGFALFLQLINRKQHYLKTLDASFTENKELIEKLEKEHQTAVNAASFDALTNLYNRRLFVSLAEQNLTKRNSLNCGVLFIDLDRFKTINDTLGHRIGDLLLKEVASRLRGCLRKSDIVSRFGGDEFVVMLTEIAEVKDIQPVAEKIIHAISQPCRLDNQQLSVSSSVGIAIFPRDGDNIEALLRNADAAMYSAKKSGRGRYSFFDSSLNTVSIKQFELEQRVGKAIANDEFVLHFQPKIRLEDSRVIGLEALVRWRHPLYELLYPNDFIDRIEESGQIGHLGCWVLEAACRQLVSWRDQGLATVPIAINVSPTEIKNPEYAAHFFQTLRRYQLQPTDIEIEVTESAIIEHEKVLKDNLRDLSDGGITISLDDFGKGFSSFSHIRSLPISTLKIDRSFIQDIRSNRNDNAIVTSTITLAKKLNLTVVAEGIESHDQFIHLKLAGCDQVQGYFFSRPLPARKIIEFLTNPHRTKTSCEQ